MSKSKVKVPGQMESDTTLFLKLEDLINIAMGPDDANIVNFKVMQTVLFTLARQMRVLDQKVEIRASELKQQYESAGGGAPATADQPLDAVSVKSEGKKKKGKSDKGDKAAADEGEGGQSDKSGGGTEEPTAEKGGTADLKSEDAGKKKGKGKRKTKGGKDDDGEEDEEEDVATAQVGDGGKEEAQGKGVSAAGEKEKFEKETEKSGGKEAESEPGEIKEVKSSKSKTAASKGKTAEQDKGGIPVQGAPSTTSAGGPLTRIGSIEVVTQKEFALLQSAVKSLQDQTSLPPPPTLPDNKKLRDDIVKGSASLTDTMQAMQLSARVQAAEKAISSMTEMLTELAAAGALPGDIAAKSAIIQNLLTGEVSDKPATKALSSKATKSTTTGISSAKSTTTGMDKSADVDGAKAGAEGKLGLTKSKMSAPAAVLASGVTHPEMEAALQALREELLRSLSLIANRATHGAENAASTIKDVSEKMEVAVKLDARITSLNNLVRDYADQLRGFDNGLNTQMTGFQEQMAQMRADLNTGVKQLENVNNNAETTAVLELTERYNGLVEELDNTLHNHQSLTSYQRQLSDELKSLVECVEMMREQKADRDEVLDGLRDKADSSRLTGLVSADQFSRACDELDQKMLMCHEKFRKQDATWMRVVSDFNNMIETKAELMQLLSHREETQDQLQDLHRKTRELARLLGDPKAAMVTRKLAKDALCGVCRVPALMEPVEPIQPTSLPAARPAPAAPPGDLEPCVHEYRIMDLDPSDVAPQPAPHMCLRWVGGSHTLTAAAPGRGHVARERASRGLAYAQPVKRFMGYGTDGKMYNLEEDMQPCVECNLLAPPKGDEADKAPEAALPPRGGGDYSRPEPRVEGKEFQQFGPDGMELKPIRRPTLEGTSRSLKSKEDLADPVPTLQARTSIIHRFSTVHMEDRTTRDTDIGQSVKGHLKTHEDPQTAELTELRSRISESKPGLVEAAAGPGSAAEIKPDDAGAGTDAVDTAPEATT